MPADVCTLIFYGCIGCDKLRSSNNIPVSSHHLCESQAYAGLTDPYGGTRKAAGQAAL